MTKNARQQGSWNQRHAVRRKTFSHRVGTLTPRSSSSLSRWDCLRVKLLRMDEWLMQLVRPTKRLQRPESAEAISVRKSGLNQFLVATSTLHHEDAVTFPRQSDMEYLRPATVFLIAGMSDAMGIRFRATMFVHSQAQAAFTKGAKRRLFL